MKFDCYFKVKTGYLLNLVEHLGDCCSLWDYLKREVTFIVKVFGVNFMAKMLIVGLGGFALRFGIVSCQLCFLGVIS